MQVLEAYSFIAIPISLIVSIVIAVAGVLPSFFVTGANIIFFGPIKGFFISLLGEVMGAYITFYIYRKGFKNRIEDQELDKYRLLRSIIRSEGKKAAVLVGEGRLLPFIPSGFVTLAAAISNINIKEFIIATAIGKIPSIALEALVSYDLININYNYMRLFLTIVSVIIIYITLKKFVKWDIIYREIKYPFEFRRKLLSYLCLFI